MKAKKKWLAILLSVCMVFTLIPTMAFASVVEEGDAFAVASVQTTDAESNTTTVYYDSVAEAVGAAADGAVVTVFKNSKVTGVAVTNAITIKIEKGIVLRLEGSNSIGSNVRIENDGIIDLVGSLDMSAVGITEKATGAGLVLNKAGKINLSASSELKIGNWFTEWNMEPGESDCIFAKVEDGAKVIMNGNTYKYGTDTWKKKVAIVKDTKYEAISEAIAAAVSEAGTAPATISLLQDVSASQPFSFEGNVNMITVDASDKTISSAVTAGKTVAEGTSAVTTAKVTLKNGKFAGGVTANGGELVLDGGEYTGTITLTDGSLTINGGDYSGATFTQATGKAIVINAGTFSFDPTIYVPNPSAVTITKNDNNTWTVTKPTKTLANATVTGLQSAYVGSTTTAVKPTDFVVKDGTTTLVKDKDYTVSYGSNILVGTATTATGYIYFTGKGDYAGTSTSASFKIVKTARSMSYATVAKIADQKYSSTIGVYGATPAVTVTWKDSTMITPITLVQGEDYTVTYSNNKAIGTASVTVKGIGAYSGYAYGSFEITGNLDLGLTVISSIPDQKYTGYDVKPSLTVKYGSTYLYEGTDYTATYSSNKYVGTGRVTITGKGKYTGTNSATFKIKYDLAGAIVTPSATILKWNGAAQAPTVTVKYGTTALTAGTDYILSSTAYNKNCGTYTVTVSAVSTSSKAMGSTSFTYTIDGTDQSITGVSSTYKKTTYTESFKLKPDAVDATGFTYTSADPDVATVSSDGTVTIKSIGTTTITISTVGNTKYNPAVKKVNLIVNPRAGYLKSVTSPSKGKLTFKYYKRPGGISGVQVRYSRYSDFRTYGTKTIVTTNSKDYSVIGTKSYTGFKSGRVLYVKTRNYKKLDDGTKLYGAWSTVKKVVVK